MAFGHFWKINWLHAFDDIPVDQLTARKHQVLCILTSYISRQFAIDCFLQLIETCHSSVSMSWKQQSCLADYQTKSSISCRCGPINSRFRWRRFDMLRQEHGQHLFRLKEDEKRTQNFGQWRPTNHYNDNVTSSILNIDSEKILMCKIGFEIRPKLKKNDFDEMTLILFCVYKVGLRWTLFSQL